jgi:predicted hydrolase (HD superfamily)
MHPTLDKHPQDGAPILREENYPEDVIDAILSHAEHLDPVRDTPLKRRLRVTGWLRARGLRASTGLDGPAQVGERS